MTARSCTLRRNVAKTNEAALGRGYKGGGGAGFGSSGGEYGGGGLSSSPDGDSVSVLVGVVGSFTIRRRKKVRITATAINRYVRPKTVCSGVEEGKKPTRLHFELSSVVPMASSAATVCIAERT